MGRCFFRRSFLLVSCLAVLGVLGERDSSTSGVLAVDTKAHLHRGSNVAKNRDAEEGSSDEMDIKALGKEIAKQLVYEMHHDRAISQRRSTSLHAVEQPEPKIDEHLEPIMAQTPSVLAHSEAAGLLQKLASIQADVLGPESAQENTAQTSHVPAGRSLEQSESARHHATQKAASSAPATAGILTELANFSHSLDTESAWDKKADESAQHAIDRSKDIVQPAGAYEAEALSRRGLAPSDRSAADPWHMQASGLRELANLFQPGGSGIQRWKPEVKPVDIPRKTVSISLAPIGKNGLDDVAGNLLQLKQAVTQDLNNVKERSSRSPQKGGVPSFDTIDKDHKGSLSLEEFRSIASAHFSDPDDTFKKIDENGSGKIDRQEYDQAVKAGIIKSDSFDTDTPKSASINIFRTHISILLLVLVAPLCFSS